MIGLTIALDIDSADGGGAGPATLARRLVSLGVVKCPAVRLGQVAGVGVTARGFLSFPFRTFLAARGSLRFLFFSVWSADGGLCLLFRTRGLHPLALTGFLSLGVFFVFHLLSVFPWRVLICVVLTVSVSGCVFQQF